MIRILLFVLVIFALGIGFAWLAERPGELVLTFNGYQYEVTLMVAAALTVAVVAAVMILWWLVKAIWTSPQTVARYFRVRRRDRGYQALSTGMIAAGAGDATLARRKKKEAMKLIRADQEPLIALLDAQASLLEGDHDAARRKFEAMLDDPEMRLLGLRGLYLEAQRLGDRTAASHYAQRAVEIAPQLGWASDAALEARTAEGDWDGALRLLDAQKSTRQIPADAANRKRAVLLTAKAMELLDADPLGAKNAATEANRLAPDLVPAAVIAAKALFRQDDLRKGSKILEAAWRKTAHPEIADAYVHARHGDSTHDRLARARKLLAQKQNNAESALTVARAALEANEFKEAREAAETALRLQQREGVFLLLADIEEAETGDQGRVRQWLARAVRAPQDPGWIADGVISERWAPASPVTGKLDAYEWRQPSEKPGVLIEQAKPDFEALEAPKTVEAEPAVEVEEEAAPAPVVVADEAKADDVIDAEVVEEASPPEEPVAQEKADGAEPRPDGAAAKPVQAAAFAAVPANDAGAEPDREAAPPIPDDPGVEPSDGEERTRRFRLF